MNNSEEPIVEEMKFDPFVLDAEQSAAWREVVREAVRNAAQLGWAFWGYLIVRLLYDLVVRYFLQ